jgi:hypothetical protein
MRRLLLCGAIPLLMAAGPAPDANRQVSLTIYNGDLALVRDVRQMNVPAGRTRLEFKDVSGKVRPETVSLDGKSLSVVEQNFDYDLLTPAKMMEKAVGKQVQIVRTITGTGKETTETATILSVNGGVVMRIGNRIEVLRDDGIPTRVIFNGIPENLRASPTLSVTVNAEGAGPRDVTLSYLTSGLSWTADYVAQFDEKEGALDMQGWVTLTNRTGTSFANVAPRLVAGTVGSASNARPYSQPYNRPAPVVQSAGNKTDRDEDFPIYSLPERVTVADNQTKQVSFLDLAKLKTRKIYGYQAEGLASQPAPVHASVALAFNNTARALPEGTVRVYTRDEQGTPKFSGEQKIEHVPANSSLLITLGEAFDVTLQSTLISAEKISRGRTRYAMKYEFHNARATPVAVELRQGGLWGRDSDVSDESLKGKQVDAHTYSWDVPVPAGGDAVLTFSATTGG